MRTTIFLLAYLSFGLVACRWRGLWVVGRKAGRSRRTEHVKTIFLHTRRGMVLAFYLLRFYSGM